MRPVDGATLGNLLYETEVPVLVLNACRSALGDTSPAPDQAAADKVVPELEDQVRVYGSLAQAVVDAGVAGVVAMRYNVYVATAAQFVGELYQVMAEGYSLGRAVTRARKHLSDMPDRAVVGAPIPLQDWLVPTVHEAGPIRLFPERTTAGPLFSLGEHWRSKSEDSNNKDELPPLPDAGFFGRDETLLALDRAFDRHKIVLMHAYAGSGKTATAAEFARWYRRTGGIAGPVLFDSFERYRPLATLLDKIGTLFGPVLESNGIHWLALDERQRRALALAILKQFPVFWIWDNVEPVTGFPSGSDSMWSAEEQQELADFLRALRDTKAKVLLTSRRDEQGWLDNLPARIRVPAMPTRERRQLAEALILRRGRDVRLVGVLAPLLSFSQGNPLTLSVLVGQALKDGLDNSADVEGFVAKLRAGEAVFDDDVEQGRSKSLGSSLSYGFEHAFDEDERKRLAVLHLFQRVVSPPVLRAIGDRENPDRHENFVGLSREYWVGLLNRAVEIGLLTSVGMEIYVVHPALPWFFRGLFERYYPDAVGEESPATRVTRAFAEAIVEWGNFLYSKLEGTRGLMAILNAEEENLLQVLRLARRHGWWTLAVQASNVICTFYGDMGRQVESIRLLRAIVADCLDVETLTSLKGREECWLDAVALGLQLGLLEHNLVAAERFYSAASKHLLAEIGDAISRETSAISEAERGLIKKYIDLTRVWIGGMVESRVRANLLATAKLGEQAFDLASRFGYHESAGKVAFHLGHCYFEIPGEGALLTEENNLLTAEKWYERSLNWVKAEDALSRSMILFELAQTRYRRMQNAVGARAGAATIESLINDAMRAALEAERIVAPEFLEGRARVHHLLGNIYDDAGSLSGDRKYTNAAANHYQEYIKLADRMGDLLDAAKGCREMARLRLKLGEFDDALVFAQEAARKCEKVGPGGEVDLDRSRGLLRDIALLKERSMGAGS
jgi:hypothetical protein